jgi:hypothetical protein
VASAAAEPLASTDSSSSSPPTSADASAVSAPASSVSPAASSTSTPASSAASYGLRAKGYKQINVLIPPDVLRSLKVRLAEEDRELSEVSTLLYKAWLEGRITI